MNCVVSYGAGASSYGASEAHVTYHDRLSKHVTDRLIVVCHGRTPGSTHGALQWLYDPNGGAAQAGAPPHLIYLTRAGYAVMAIDAGGNTTWGNGDASSGSVKALADAIAWARANGVCHPTAKVLPVGYSMGNLVVLNYLRVVGQAQVAGYIGEASPYNIDTFHADALYTAEIDAAYPSGYTVSNPPSFAAGITVPTRLFHASDDTVVPIGQSTALLAALGSPDKALTTIASGDHTGLFAGIDPKTLLAWLAGLSW